jgi:hypothetical protein
MENLEKQEVVDLLKTIVKARWFVILVVFAQGIILKIFGHPVPMAKSWINFLIFLAAILLNVYYWLYLRRPLEKMSKFGLEIIKSFQVLGDLFWESLIIYFSGTVSKMVIVLYSMSIMVGASIYRTGGVIFSTLLCQMIFTFLAFLQFKGIMQSDIPSKEIFGTEFKLGDYRSLFFLLVGFYSYSWASAIFAGYLAKIFRKREEKLIFQKDALQKRTEELVRLKNLLEEALKKSEISRAEEIKAKELLQKVNLELNKKIEELEKFYKTTVGRELKMVELKKKINELEEELKKYKKQ